MHSQKLCDTAEEDAGDQAAGAALLLQQILVPPPVSYVALLASICLYLPPARQLSGNLRWNGLATPTVLLKEKLGKIHMAVWLSRAAFGRSVPGKVLEPVSAENPYFTIGHSTRSIEEFVSLLREAKVRLLVDVRSIPRSRTNPQFNIDVLPNQLASYQIGCLHIAELGGLRGKQKAVERSGGSFWRNKSFQNYADYTLSPAFQNGLAQLRGHGTKARTAIMCAETVWWRCHRRIIADYLLSNGQEVFHILGPGNIVPASLTKGAHASNGRVTYTSGEGEQA